MLSRLLPLVVLLAASVMSLAEVIAQGPPATTPPKITDFFEKNDRNKDKLLDEAEYSSWFQDKKLASRDFRLADWNGDGKLTLEETSSASTIAGWDIRGRLPHPLTKFVDTYFERLAKRWPQLKGDAPGTVPRGEFCEHAAACFGAPDVQPTPRDVDIDGNMQVSANEARRYVESLLGVRRDDGRQLVYFNGTVFNYGHFSYLDVSKDGFITLAEARQRNWGGDKVDELFKSIDKDEDGRLTFDEGSKSQSFVKDIMWEFRTADTDFDAAVSPEELKAKIPSWQATLEPLFMQTFDTDRDGKLSFMEWQLSFLGLPIYNWHEMISGKSPDGKLRFEEFRFGGNRTDFVLLRWELFRMHDRNGDGVLDEPEFRFKGKVPSAFYTLSADGKEWKKLYQHPEFNNIGSPSVSPDGKRLAFDGYKDELADNAMFVVDMDGKNLKALGSGMMPNWSPDGTLLTASLHRGNPYGAWILKPDGMLDRVIVRGGWGAQWSPDGKKISYTSQINNSATLCVIDLETEKVSVVMEGDSGPYQQVYWNASWSPDCSQLVFKAKRKDGKEEVAVVNAAGAEIGFKTIHTGTSITADFAWHPEGDRVVFPMLCPERGRTQLYEFNPEKNAPPKLVPGQDPKLDVRGCTWTPDGTKLIAPAGVN